MMRLTHTLLFLFTSAWISLFLFRQSACTPSASSNSQNVSQIYRSSQEVLHPSYAIFHRTNTTSELHFRISSKELLYSRQGGNDNFTARLSLHYRLLSSYENVGVIDSATILINDTYSPAIRDIMTKLDFSATFTNAYNMEIFLTDLNRNTTTRAYLVVDKVTQATRQNFLVLSKETKTPIFRDYIGKDEKIFIRHRGNMYSRLTVRYYNRSFPMPEPPFSTANNEAFEYKADSIFTLEVSDKDTAGITFPKKGFYHIQADPQTQDGLTLYRFDEDYPMVKRPDQMLPPLTYITSKNEIDKLKSYSNPKAAVDSFWVWAGGSHDRARELVRKYYNRVQDANIFFSSYVEGWRSDRGMVYLVYGPPNTVYRSSGSENWVYGEENNFNSLTFSFVKVINPFTDNDYRLERNQVFRTGWYNAVEMWRQGRVHGQK